MIADARARLIITFNARQLGFIDVSHGAPEQLSQVSWHVLNRFQMTDFVLQVEDLVKLNLLHLAYLDSYFDVGCLVFSIGRVSKDVI